MTNLVLEFTDAAEAEFYDIVEYYKEFDRSLSNDFIQEFERTIQRLMKISRCRSSLPTSDKACFT